MKTRTFFIIATLLLTFTSNAQTWIGNLFSVDTTIRLSEKDIPEDLSHLKYNISNGVFYYTDMRAFQDKSTTYQATIYGISLSNYVRTKITFPFPSISPSADMIAKTFWVNDFHITRDTIVISVQDHILRYHKGASEVYIFDTMYTHPNIKATYLHQGNLYFFEEDHDTGYKWFRYDSKSDQPVLIQQLLYEAPHVVQAAPNRYLFHDDHYVYFLSTRYPTAQKYDLEGHWVENIVFDLPNWHPFEDEYIQKSLSYPYGIERIKATMGEIFNYSYLKYLFPIGGDYLMYYTQFDTITQKSSPHYAIKDSTGISTYNFTNSSDSIFDETIFPFYLFDATAEKARISWNNRLVELILDDSLTWHGLRPSEYKHQRETFFRKHDPIPSIRIMTYRNSQPITQPFFFNSESHYKSIADLPIGKSILLINNELECSACRNELLSALNKMDSSIHIGILYPFFPGALQQREMEKEIERHLTRDYTLYFLDPRMYTQYPRYITSVCDTFPGILFYETDKVPVLFSVDDIFGDDPINIQFSQKFQSFWNDFLLK